jgi:spermidine/putrescine transport system substrate-binding protein
VKKLTSIPLYLLVTASILGLMGCGSPHPALSSKTFNLYAFSDYVPQELIDGFEKETGVKVTYSTYATNEEMIVGMEKAPGNYDLIVPSDYAVEQLIKSDSLLPIDLNKVANLNNINAEFLHPYFDPGDKGQGSGTQIKYSLPYLWGTTGIVYNRKKVNGKITSWKDLWRPEFSGHIVLLDDAREMMGVALLALGYDKNETNPAKLAEARDKLKELTPGVVAFDAETPEKYLLSGDAWIGVVYNGNAALAERQNPDLVYSLPKEGAGFWIDNMAIPRDAKHADAALAFIDYVLTPKVGALLIQGFPYSTPNSATLDYIKASNVLFYNSYMTSLASSPPENSLLNAKFVQNIDAVSANLYNQYWSDVKSHN